MAANLNKSAIALLATIVAATQSSGNGFVVLNAPATKALIEGKYIEVNEAITQNGEVAARATQAGIDFTASQGTEAGQTPAGDAAQGSSDGTAAAPAVAKKTFSIEKAVPLVEKTRAPVAEQYPFADMEIGDSFFVANSDVKSGNAYKTLNSTVNTANLRFSVETGETRPHRRNPSQLVPVRKQERKFELRHFALDDGTKGARIYRVEVPAETTAS